MSRWMISATKSSPSSRTTRRRPPDDKTACTQADTLRATSGSSRRSTRRSIVVTGGAGKMETDEVFKVLGYPEVIGSEGVEWFDHNKAPFVAGRPDFRPAAADDGKSPGSHLREARLAGATQGALDRNGHTGDQEHGHELSRGRLLRSSSRRARSCTRTTSSRTSRHFSSGCS